MNTDTITHWLQSPATLPDEAAVKSLLQAWPWFVPAQLMEAARKHRQSPFSPQSIALIRLYGPDWVSAYRLLTDEGGQSFHTLPKEEPDNNAPEPTDHQSEEEAAEKEAASPEIPDDLPIETGVPLIRPLYTEDYFRHQGVSAVPEQAQPGGQEPEPGDPKTLMVMMSFAEWLGHFKSKSEKEQEEERDKRALRSMWQQEKLAAALDDEPDEIPEDVFEMAVSSITREDDLASESLAEILERQEKWSAAAEMYRKLGLLNPSKSAYFASRADAAKKRLL